LVLLLIASHHGGSLTHGQGFLTQNAPLVIRGWMARWGAPEPRSKPSESVAAGAVQVAKVFEAKCVSCHGPDKQKGKFRVDQRESLLKGGQSGEAAVVPGDPGRSRLMRLVLLPASHDDVMPPSGKVPLSESEILSLLRWIQLGAP
jgi:mono/diheme cytochrome c family protein